LTVLGTFLALVLALTIAFAVLTIWRFPFRGLGILVAGMAVHNILLMLLIRLRTPSFLIRGIQLWKELLLLVLTLLVGRTIWKSWKERTFPSLLPLDILLLGYMALTGIYVLIPRTILPEAGNLTQRVISLRLILLLPLLYLCGRFLAKPQRADLQWVARILLGSAAIVGLVGLWELWFVRTSTWVQWGAIDFAQWLGYSPTGAPGGLQENFFQSLGQGVALRRMVSTYLSPLGIAYTGLLLFPLAVGLILGRPLDRPLSRWFCWLSLTLLTVSILFSVTRLALVCLACECGLLALLYFPRRAVLAVSITTVISVGFVLYEYPRFGPLVDHGLADIRLPAGLELLDQNSESASNAQATKPVDSQPIGSGQLVQQTVGGADPSVRGHLSALKYNLAYMQRNPLGTGIGSAILRYGESNGPTESAVFRIIGELGIPGGLLFLASYALGLYYGLRAWRQNRNSQLLSAYTLVALIGGLAMVPIMMTSDVWGNFSVTFLLWWSFGFAATLTQASTSAKASTSEGEDFSRVDLDRQVTTKPVMPS
jgi:hypothetical protein